MKYLRVETIIFAFAGLLLFGTTGIAKANTYTVDISSPITDVTYLADFTAQGFDPSTEQVISASLYLMVKASYGDDAVSFTIRLENNEHESEWVHYRYYQRLSLTLEDFTLIDEDGTIEYIVTTYSGWGYTGAGAFTIETEPTSTNLVPLADAGADFSVPIGTIASLNGGASTDPDLNYPLTYAWTFNSVPSGSEGLILTNADTVSPTFTPEIPGDYVVELVVTDDLGALSLPDTVTVNTYNTPPIADAGVDQVFILTGSLVLLDGSGSYDDDGDDISYIWEILQQPEGSSAGLDDYTSITPTFVADVNGEYLIGLTVTDIWGAMDTDDMAVSFSNVAPVADAGVNQSAVVGEVVSLNGAESFDANGDPITYSWSLSAVPDGSTAVISEPTIVAPSFTADLSGTYIASLVVNDGIVDSAADSAEIVVVSFNTLTTQTVSETIDLINETPVETFRNVNLSNALTNKLNAVLKMIANEQYGQAWSKLTTDILPKTDGCALYGVPDKKDWIETCEEQEPVYNYILETIELLEMKL
jgi:PKD repeat protein